MTQDLTVSQVLIVYYIKTYNGIGSYSQQMAEIKKNTTVRNSKQSANITKYNDIISICQYTITYNNRI